MRLIVATTTPDEGSREDYNLAYAGFILIESDTLLFDEPVFDEISASHDELVEKLTALGYRVLPAQSTIVEVEDV